MNRTHNASAANPNSAAPIPATASMVSGAVKRVPTRAPTHNPAYEAPQASSGVTSQPNTMRRCANQRGTAAPAIPSTWRACVRRAGRKLTARPVASTTSVSSTRCGTTAVTWRDTNRNTTTATAVSTPTWVPPTITVRKSERSDAVAVAVADMVPQVFRRSDLRPNLNLRSHRANTASTVRSVTDHPVHPSHRLETEWRHRIQERHGETHRVREAERSGQGERECLAAREQGDTEGQEMPRDGRRADQVADVALVLVEHTVDRERAAVQAQHPEHERPQRGQQPLPARRSRQAHRQQVAQRRVGRHDRPFSRPQMQ